jgi:hypothetical protein
MPPGFPPKGVVEPSTRGGGPYGHQLLSAENRSPSGCQRGSREIARRSLRNRRESRRESAIEGVADRLADRVPGVARKRQARSTPLQCCAPTGERGCAASPASLCHLTETTVRPRSTNRGTLTRRLVEHVDRGFSPSLSKAAGVSSATVRLFKVG